MGYTHYWKKSKNKIDDNTWKEFLSMTRRMTKLIQGKTTTSAGGYYPDDTVKICGPMGNKKLLANKDYLAFNGNEDQGLDHESFVIMRSKASDFEFCKTARKPYDVLCVAVLIMANEMDIIDEWRSDGDDEDHTEGKELYALAVRDRKLSTVS